jgi:hypothetical protein
MMLHFIHRNVCMSLIVQIQYFQVRDNDICEPEGFLTLEHENAISNNSTIHRNYLAISICEKKKIITLLFIKIQNKEIPDFHQHHIQ